MKTQQNKSFDCLEYKYKVQEQIYNKIKNLSWEEEKAFFEENAKKGSFAQLYNTLSKSKVVSQL